MCCVCRCKAEKTDLIRIVKKNTGEIIMDDTHKANGRGLYICKSKDCLAKAIKTKALNRGFKQEVNEHIYELLGKVYD